MQWGHPVSSAAGVGSRSVRYRWIFVLKQNRTPANFCVRQFWGPFGFQLHLLGVKLDPFKTLKIQWGTWRPAPKPFRCAPRSPGPRSPTSRRIHPPPQCAGQRID